MLMAASFIITKLWKQRRHPSVKKAKSMNGGTYTDTVEYSSAVKSNELSSHKKTRVTLKCLWLSDRKKPVGQSYPL